MDGKPALSSPELNSSSNFLACGRNHVVSPWLKKLTSFTMVRACWGSHVIRKSFSWRSVLKHENIVSGVTGLSINPLRPKNDESQTSHSNIKGVSVSEVMRIENMITQVQFY